MTPREKVICSRPDSDVFAAMESLRERDGVPFSEQIRRSLRTWLEAKKVLKERAVRKRPASRKRP